MTPLTLLGLPWGQLLPIAATGTAALTLLYVLRQRRRRLEVPFSPLWQKVLGQSEAQSLWQKLLRVLSLLLQLLVLALLTVSLGDPRLGRSTEGRSLVLLVDASASMQAMVPALPGKTRLDLARSAAEELIRGLHGDDLGVVVQLDGRPAPLGGFSDDERELLSQLGQVTARDTTADLQAGLLLAQALLQGRPRPQIILFSDGGFDESALGSQPSGVDVRFVPLPKSAQLRPSDGNAAITSFAVRRYRRNRLSYEVLLQLSYFPAPGSSTTAKQATLQLYQEGALVDVQKLDLVPGEQTRKLYPSLSGAGTHLEAVLSLSDGDIDLLPVDNHAFAVLPERKRVRLLLVTRGNLFLEGALLAASAGEENHLLIDKVAPTAYSDEKAARYDAVLFDAWTPPQPPDAHAIYLDPQGDTSPFEIAKTVTAPYLSDLDEQHPVLRWVSLADINMSRASVFRLGSFDRPLAQMLKDPIVIAREQPGPAGVRKSVALGFDVRQSDLPLRVAFPVLLMNAMDWFAGDVDEDLGSFRTGQTLVVPLRTGQKAKAPDSRIAQMKQVNLMLPSGQLTTVPVHEGIVKLYGEQAGFYNLQVPELLRGFALALNLAAAEESSVLIRSELRLQKTVLRAPDAGQPALKRTLWPYLLLVALLLLLLEWWTYHRRWTV
jgi:hypothetical protein